MRRAKLGVVRLFRYWTVRNRRRPRMIGLSRLDSIRYAVKRLADRTVEATGKRPDAPRASPASSGELHFSWRLIGLRTGPPGALAAHLCTALVGAGLAAVAAGLGWTVENNPNNWLAVAAAIIGVVGMIVAGLRREPPAQRQHHARCWRHDGRSGRHRRPTRPGIRSG